MLDLPPLQNMCMWRMAFFSMAYPGTSRHHAHRPGHVGTLGGMNTRTMVLDWRTLHVVSSDEVMCGRVAGQLIGREPR